MAAQARTRSEYRLAALDDLGEVPSLAPVPAESVDRRRLATMFLAAYRGTIDDEGEDLDDALVAVERYLAESEEGRAVVVVDDGGELTAFCSVTVGDGRRYVDPIVVAPAAKGRGLGRGLVRWVLDRLRADGVQEVGATITDGNVPSERLFAGLGFVRVGPWPPEGDERG